MADKHQRFKIGNSALILIAITFNRRDKCSNIYD